MSIIKRTVVVCDKCRDEMPCEGNSIKAAQAIAKQAGWAQVKASDKEVQDLCPKCWAEMFAKGGEAE